MSERHANAEGLAKAIAIIATGDSINARLVKAGLPAMEDCEAASLALVRASGIKSQGEATVLVVNLTGGACNADQITAALKLGFPSAKIGARHGPHYLSLARTGKLEGVEATSIPHSARKVKKATVVVAPASTEVVETPAAQPDTSALKAELEALSQKDLAARAKAAGVKAIGKKEDIVVRVLAAS